MSAESDIKRPAEILLELCAYLDSVATHSKGRIEIYRELFDQEYLDIETYHRMISNEQLGLLAEIDNFIGYYRGLN